MTRTPHRIEIRTAQPADVAGIAKVHAASRERAYRGLIPDQYVVSGEAASSERWRTAVSDVDRVGHRVFVAEADGQVVGVAATELLSPQPLELGALYVDPSYWRQRIGMSLTEAVLKYASGLEQDHVVAWVAAKNEAAKRFYFANDWWLDGGAEVRGEKAASYVVQRFRHTVASRGSQ